MSKDVRKRLLHFLIVLIGVSLLSFLLVAVSGIDPAEQLARRSNVNATPEQIESVRRQLGLDAPLPVRYLNWVKGFFTGELGISIYTYQPVAQDLAALLPVTFSLVGLALLWIVLLAVPISLLCARFRGSAADQAVRGMTILGICLPSFWLGFLLLLAFAVEVPIFKVLPEPGIKGYILPSIALAVPVACSMIRLFRASLLSELSGDYVQYAKARGLSPCRILIHHVLRNALPPIITVFCQYLGYLLAGSAMVESVFSLKGMGGYLLGSIRSADAAASATCILLIAGGFVLANLAGDLVNRALCPWMVRESNG